MRHLSAQSMSASTVRDWPRVVWARLRSSPALQRWLVLAAIVGVLAGQKVWLSEHTVWFSVDGGFYANVAMNVRDGHGLATDVSLYHKAHTYFPHPTSVYPLWPLVLGGVAKLVPLETAAVWLPTLLYFVALVVGYLWARRLTPGGLGRGPLALLDAGHLFVFVLGMNRSYFYFTSMPFTEALSYVLVCVALWRSADLLQRPSWRSGLELGLWIGAAVLTRSQVLILAIAAAATLGWASLALPHRPDHRRAALAFAVAFVAVLAPHFVYMASFLENPGLSSFIHFETARTNDLLSPLEVYAATHGLWGYLTDRLQGLPVAFSPTSPMGYRRIFHTFIYAIPLAVPLVAFSAARALGPARRRATLDWLRSEAALPWILAVLFAAGSFVALHSLHKTYLTEWPFARRHAIQVVFLTFLCLAFLARHARVPVQLIAAIVVLTGTAEGYQTIHAMAKESVRLDHRPKKTMRARVALAAWLVEQRAQRGELVVAMSDNEAQRLAWRAPGVSFHWVHEATSRRDLETLIEVLGVDYLVVRTRKSDGGDDEGEAGAPRDLGDLFERVAVPFEPEPFIIYAARGAAPPSTMADKEPL
jgi:hypothetical protein